MSYHELNKPDEQEYFWMKSESFLTILPTSLRNNTIHQYTGTAKPFTHTIFPLTLRVIRPDSVKMTPDVNITVNDLNRGKKQFLNNTGEGDKFRVNVIIKPEDKWESAVFMYNADNPDEEIGHLRGYVVDVLDKWIREMTRLYVVTRAIDIKNGEYIITSNPSRKQTNEGYTIWELEFTKYTGVVITGFKTSNTYHNRAIAKYKKKKATAAKKAKVKKVDPYVTKFKKCNSKGCPMKYSKKKKKCICTMYLQYLLAKHKFYPRSSKIDGWFGSQTLAAVKKFQTKYKKKYNLSVNGKVDKKTKEAIIKVG